MKVDVSWLYRNSVDSMLVCSKEKKEFGSTLLNKCKLGEIWNYIVSWFENIYFVIVTIYSERFPVYEHVLL